jgi:hypothetical protein
MADTFNLLNPDSSEIEAQRIIVAPTSATAGTLLCLDSSKNATTTTAVAVKGTTLVFQLNAAPADGSLAANDLAIWFDNTNGAGKAMFKGKTANGTVVTGSVTLS